MDTLELMRTFVAVVDSSSFTVAGQRLGKSKALVSKHIYELEGRLGARLLNRTTRRVRMTEIGRAYHERARSLLNDFAMLEEQVRSETGAPQTLGELELMEMVTAYRDSFPSVDVELFLADRLVDLIGEGFEVALRITTLNDSSLIARKLCDMRLILCAAPAYLEHQGTPETPDDLTQHRTIVDTNIRWRENWRFNDEDDKPVAVRVSPTLAVNSATAVHQALLAGQGIGFCPEFAVARDIRAGRLIELLPDLSDHKLGVYIVYPHRLHLSAKVRSFIDFTSAWYVPTPPWLRG